MTWKFGQLSKIIIFLQHDQHISHKNAETKRLINRSLYAFTAYLYIYFLLLYATNSATPYIFTKHSCVICQSSNLGISRKKLKSHWNVNFKRSLQCNKKYLAKKWLQVHVAHACMQLTRNTNVNINVNTILKCYYDALK